jgi:O-antigen ligase
LTRFDPILAGDSTGGRLPIWRETIAMIQDFVMTGVGGGAYPTGMLVYQQSSRQFFFNQAHNHYLQILAEGGLLVAVPLGIAALAFGAVAVARLRADTSASYWIRAGAAAGIAGVLVQSFWDIGLAIAANALLFAAACGILVHDDKYRRRSADRRHRRLLRRHRPSQPADQVQWIR